MKKSFFKILAIATVIGFGTSACKDDPSGPSVTEVTVSPETANVVKGKNITFTARVIGSNNPLQTVIWSIVETGKNAATTINENGTLTVAIAENLASLTVKATSTVDNSKSGTATVIISDDTPSDSFNNITAAQLVSEIKVGWNLGNTLDCTNVTWFGPNPTVTQLETAWGNPVTTKANIDALKNAGFNAIRIPVSWAKCADANYNIRADWMARVKEVVNYAVDNNMYILLNTHHDESIFKFLNKDMEESQKAFKMIWGQIANAFKSYNEKLVFEALNEPRTAGSQNEWNGGTAEERNNLNIYYRLFVETVRASGGNNEKRVLMINTYGASAVASAMNSLEIPNDIVNNKIIVSIHAYAPYNFALNANSAYNTWNRNSSADTNPIAEPINLAYNTFVSKGIPVILGEFGAMNKNNIAAGTQWAEYFVNYAKNKEIPCFWWDNGSISGDGEKFGLLDRKTNNFSFPEIVAALMKGATGEDMPPPPQPTSLIQ